MTTDALKQSIESRLDPYARREDFFTKIGMPNKLQELAQASEAKRQFLAELPAKLEKEREEYSKTWAGQVDPTFSGAANMAANFVSGAGKVAGWIASAPYSAINALDADTLSEEDIAAFNRMKQNIATPEDLTRLNTKRSPLSEDAKARTLARTGTLPAENTPLEILNRMEGNRATQEKIQKATDFSNIVDQRAKSKLSQDLSKDFDANWGSVTKGWDAIDNGYYMHGAKNIVTGVAKLLANAGDSIISNPNATAQYIVENLPQVGIGGLGITGKAAMTASNVGYAADEYRKGIQEYQRQHNGQLPPQDVRDNMMLNAGLIAVAEQFGDVAQLGLSKVGTKAVKNATKESFKKSLLNVGKATGTGALTEGVTEGIQTYAEGEAGYKPKSAFEIYEGATIGAASGGALTGIGRAATEASQTTPEQIEAKRQEQIKAREIKAAVEASAKSGDISAFIDPESTMYAPERAVQALYIRGTDAKADPEVKAQSYGQAKSIVETLTQEVDQLEELSTPLSEQEIKDYSSMVSEIDTKLSQASETDAALIEKLTASKERIQSYLDNNTDENIEANTVKYNRAVNKLEVAKNIVSAFDESINKTTVKPNININTDIDSVITSKETTPDIKSKVDSVINLSMQIPDDKLDALINSNNPNISADQMKYLRQLSANRIAENEYKKGDQVNKEILFGSDPNKEGTYFAGIENYRKRVSEAIGSNNKATAESALKTLTKFAESHVSKVAAINEAMKKGEYSSVSRIKGTNNWVVDPVPLTKAEAKKAGSIVLRPKEENTIKQVNVIRNEAMLLRSALKELKAAVGLKFNEESKTNKVETKEATNDTLSQQTRKVSKEDTVEDKGQSTGTKEEVQNREVSEGTGEAVQVAEDTETKENKSKGKLEIFTQKEELKKQTISEVYNSGNVLARFIKQAQVSDFYKTNRPLVAVKDFLTAWNNGDVAPESFLSEEFDDGITEEQQSALNNLRETLSSWIGSVKDNIIKVTPNNNDFRTQDMMQFLIDDQGKTEENVTTAIAYAAYTKVLDMANGLPLQTQESLNRMFGYEKEMQMYGDMKGYNVLAPYSTFKDRLIIDLGKAAIDALGFKAEKDAPLDLLPKLENALGTHAYALLVRQNLLVTKGISQNEVTSYFLPTFVPEDSKVMYELVGLAWNKTKTNNQTTYTLPNVAKKIREANIQSETVVDRLFGLEEAPRMATTKPMKYTQVTTKGTMQDIPVKQRKVYEIMQKTPHTLNQNMYAVIEALGKENILRILGKQDIEIDRIHKDQIDSVEAQNNNLERQYDLAMEMFADGDLDKRLFITGEVWGNQRGGITTLSLNQQTSKFHRELFNRPNWVQEIDLDNDTELNNFLKMLSANLGLVNIDNTVDANVQEEFKTKLSKNKAVMQAARMLQKLFYPKSVEDSKILENTGNQEVIIAATGHKPGSTSIEALHALVNFAAYLEANDKKQEALKTNQEYDSKFTSTMLVGADGKTNGPILAMALMGGAATSSQLQNMLLQGGFYPKEEGAPRNYNEWKQQPGTHDLYQRVIGIAMRNVLKGKVPEESFRIVRKTDKYVIPDYLYTDNDIKNLFVMTKPLINGLSGIVTSEGRNIIKTPLTAFSYSATVINSILSMENKFIDKFSETIQDIALGRNSGITSQEYLTAMNYLVKRFGGKTQLPVNTPVEDLLKYSLTKDQEEALRLAFNAVLSKGIESSMNTYFKTLIANRNTLNKAINAGFLLSNKTLEILKQKEIESLIKEDKLPSRTVSQGKEQGKVVPKSDMTREQQEAFLKKNIELAALVHTPMSLEEGNLNAGILMGKGEMVTSQDPLYENKVSIKNPIKNSLNKLSNKVSSLSMTYRETAPGVSAMALLTHSTDAAAMFGALGKYKQALNIHDQISGGVKDITGMALAINKSVAEALLTYSPMREVMVSNLRILDAVDRLYTVNNPSGEVQLTKEEYKNILLDVLKGVVSKKRFNEIVKESNGDLRFIAAELVDHFNGWLLKSKQADTVRLEMLSNLGSVDQYPMEKGNWIVSEDYRARAKKQLDELNDFYKNLEDQLKESFDALYENESIEEYMRGYDETNEDTTVDSNAPLPRGTENDLAALMDLEPVMDKQDIMDMFNYMSIDKSTAKGMITTVLVRNLPDNIILRYVDSETDPSTILEQPKKPSHAWFVSKDGKNEIYVLGRDQKGSLINTEVLLHEMVHAVLARKIDTELKAKAKNENHNSEAYQLIEELNKLMSKAREYVKSNSLNKFDVAVNDIQEFVAYGMTDQNFQKEVLNNISIQSKTNKNNLVKGLKEFIKIITDLFFVGSNFSRQKIAVNGLAVLIKNVSGLMAAVKADTQTNKDTDLNLSMAQQVHKDLYDYTTQDIFTALRNPAQALSNQFENHLSRLLDTIVTRLHGPYGSFKESLMTQQSIDPLDVWVKAQATGAAPFASKSLAGNFTISEQEAFVVEQIEAAVSKVLNDRVSSTFAATRELKKLYAEAKAKIKPSDLDTDPVKGKALYDFLFTGQGTAGNNDYLSRFISLGLGHEKINAALNFSTNIADRDLSNAKTIGDKLGVIFERFLAWLSGLMTRTYQGQSADSKLESLVDSLIDIENRKRRRIEAAINLNTKMKPVNDKIKEGVDTLKDVVTKAASSEIITNSKSGLVRGGGALVRIVAQDRVDKVLDFMSDLHNQFNEGKRNLAMDIIRDVRGFPAWAMTLVRAKKHNDALRQKVAKQISTQVLDAFNNEGKDLSEEDKKAITDTFIRTGAHLLLDGNTSLQDIRDLTINYQGKLDNEISATEALLSAPKAVNEYYKTMSKYLAHFINTGENKCESGLLFNAMDIARQAGPYYETKLDKSTIDANTKIIDKLITLYALKYQKLDSSSNAYKVLDTELSRNTGENGVEMVMLMHKRLESEAREKLFKDNESLMIKGWTPEILNPYISFQVVEESEVENLVNLGWSKGEVIATDPAENVPARRFMFIRDGGLSPYITSAVSLTGLGTKGSKLHNGFTNPTYAAGMENAQKQLNVTKNKAKVAHMDYRVKPSNWTPDSVKGNFMAPVLNSNGEFSNWRYMMTAQTRNGLMERNNRFENILGEMGAATFDKVKTQEQNSKVIDALLEDFKNDFAKKPEAFTKIGFNSNDPELRELWRLLPDAMRSEITTKFGKDGFYVKKELVTVLFGYRKLSLGDVYDKDWNQRTAKEDALVWTIDHLLYSYARATGKSIDEADKYVLSAGYRIRKAENIWQALVRETKDNLVIKTGGVLLGNFTSNISLLLANGVSLKDVVRHHYVAMRALTDWNVDTKRLADLKSQVEMDYGITNLQDIQNEIALLEDAINRNPVKELIDAGLMPTIVEDVENQDDPYSYRGVFVRKVEGITAKLNPTLVNVGKQVLMTHDTALYRGLSKATQMSDFVARYTLYQHLTTRLDSPMTSAEAIHEAGEAFINYDVPMSPALQYTDDMGITMFTKYFIRIQRILVKLGKEHPMRVLLMISLDHYLNLMPVVTDSSAVAHLGNNPLNWGALQYPSTLDELFTVNTAARLLK